MKVIFFEKVVFEGNNEECQRFKRKFLDSLMKLADELNDTYPMKKTDTWETYFEALKTLNPFVYETLSYIKDALGQRFIKFYFDKMSLTGINIKVYRNLEEKTTRMWDVGFIFNIVALELNKPEVWRIEE